MATVNDTHIRASSKPEKIARWLFAMSGNYKYILGFLLITALTVISIRFNYELGKLSAVDETSKELLPAGYALLDLCALFLSGYVAVKSQSFIRKCIAWGWFCVLLALSLWAAATFTISIDNRLQSKDLMHAIEQKKTEVDGLNDEVKTWRENVKNAVKFKTKHQKTLDGIQARQKIASDELRALEKILVAPTMAIYDKAAPYTPLDADTLSLVVRLIWSGAMTLSPLVIVLLIVAELNTTPATPPKPHKEESTPNAETADRLASWRNRFENWRNKRNLSRLMATLKRNSTHELKETNAEMQAPSALQPMLVSALTPNASPKTVESVAQNEPFTAKEGDKVLRFPNTVNRELSNVKPKKGHNQHTTTSDLNGLKYALEWLARQPVGRITRAKLGHAAKIHTRDGVTRIIDTLIEEGYLVRAGNGQLYRADKAEQSTKRGKV